MVGSAEFFRVGGGAGSPGFVCGRRGGRPFEICSVSGAGDCQCTYPLSGISRPQLPLLQSHVFAQALAEGSRRWRVCAADRFGDAHDYGLLLQGRPLPVICAVLQQRYQLSAVDFQFTLLFFYSGDSCVALQQM